MNLIKLQFFTALMFLFSTTAFSQSKKQQIEELTTQREILTTKVDSISDWSDNLSMQFNVQRKINGSISFQNQKLSNKLSDLNDSIQRKDNLYKELQKKAMDLYYESENFKDSIGPFLTDQEQQDYINLKYKAHGLSSSDFQVIEVKIRDKRIDPDGKGNEYSETVIYSRGAFYYEISGYEYGYSFLFVPTDAATYSIESLKKDLAIEKYKRGSGHKFFKDWEELYDYYQEDYWWRIFRVTNGDINQSYYYWGVGELEELMQSGFLVQMGENH